MKEELLRKIDVSGEEGDSFRSKEWLVTNGLGGYASGTLTGEASRRYHGLLIAALPSPYGRTVMLDHLFDRVRLPGSGWIRLHGQNWQDGIEIPSGMRPSVEFRLEMGLPVWRIQIGEFIIEKSILMPRSQNTVRLTYRYISGGDPILLQLQPAMRFRTLGEKASAPLDETYMLTVMGSNFEVSSPREELKLRMVFTGNSSLCLDRNTTREVFYAVDAQRGVDSRGLLWTPGNFETKLSPGGGNTLIASTEPFNVMLCMSQEEAFSAEQDRRRQLLYRALPNEHSTLAAELVLSADQFLIAPVGRSEDAARTRAAGNDIRTIIAGYHWFTDWGRDTMISLEGLTLCTGRSTDAAWILRTFAYYIRDGLIPNLFPEGQIEGLYHTADATLWYFHAIDRYVEATGDRETLRHLLPHLQAIVEYHRRGTRFGIGADPDDGLLRQGMEGYQLTWMDAKVDSWVVTPRRGKAVEINALWYNALRLIEQWLIQERGEAAAESYKPLIEQVRSSFNDRFWFERGRYLYDVVDGEHGDDSALRPNQLLAISLRYPVLDEVYWRFVVENVEESLLTPVGLRSLSPGHSDYKSKYYGDLRARDAAYHQGTVWAWLIGPFVDAWLKVNPEDRAGARRFLEGFAPHLNEGGIGTISEIFDGDPPFAPRGCIAQAWSVAEVLRCWLKTSS
ncbi:MAG: glycogen debranching protein [Desulfobacteraceae bacterium]|nr:MAG: glycogen debranching protein [Desulfobacteraceae bacterium]